MIAARARDREVLWIVSAGVGPRDDVLERRVAEQLAIEPHQDARATMDALARPGFAAAAELDALERRVSLDDGEEQAPRSTLHRPSIAQSATAAKA